MYVELSLEGYSYDNLISVLVWNRDGNMDRIRHCYFEIVAEDDTIDRLYRSDIIPSNHRGNVYRIDGPLIDDVPSSYFVDWNSSTGHETILLQIK